MVACLSPFERARAYTAKYPEAISGQGGHNTTFALAMDLAHGFCLSPGEVWRLLNEYNARCKPPWSERELRHKVESAFTTTPLKPRGWLLESKRPVLMPAPAKSISTAANSVADIMSAVNKLCGDFNVSEADVWEMSPVRLDGKPQDDFKLVCDWLFKPGELLNVVTDFELDANDKPRPAGKGITRPREEWLASGLPACKAGGWMRMNPVDGQGVADSNVTSFRYALLECDILPLDLQLRLLARLPLPVAMILKSGKRSLHAWIQVDAPTLDDYRARVTKMLELLAPVGVDTKNKNASRLSRLPGGCRELDGDPEQKLQRVLYLNPNPKNGGLYALRP